MSKGTKRKDKTIAPKNNKNINLDSSLQQLECGGYRKAILILVEGATEKDYFSGLISNEYLKNQLSGVDVKIGGSALSTMLIKAMEQIKNGYEQIWLVFDNDKRNAFLLNKTSLDKLKKNLPTQIYQSLETSFQEDYHNYFFSRYDYLNWVSSALGDQNTLKHWDTIQESTDKSRDFEKYLHKNPYSLFMESILFKNKSTKLYNKINITEAKKFDINWKNYTELAYSSISFEFWLLLHFEKNKTDFLWVDKGKDKTIDIATYFRAKYRPNYQKGNKNDSDEPSCTSYRSLLDNYKTKILSLKEQRKVILRVIEAYRNSYWLKRQMSSILKRQDDKWYEVNPYINGLDTLIKDLLNIELSNKEIDYYEWYITFIFHNSTLSLTIRNDAYNSIDLLNDYSKDSFKILTTSNNEYLPIKIPTTRILDRGNTTQLDIDFDIPSSERKNLILFFKDPRPKSKSPKLIILIDNSFLST